MTTKIDSKKARAIAEKFLALSGPGLVCGMGNPKAGEMCIEACLCAALDLPHGDVPTCVGNEVRRLSINLNDAPWSNDQARAAGLKRFGVAQIGSDQIDQDQFRERLSVKCVSRLMPKYMRKFCADGIDEFDDAQKKEIAALADDYAAVTDFAQVEKIRAAGKRVRGKDVGVVVGVVVVGVVVGVGVGGGVGVGVVGWREHFRKYFGDEMLVELADLATETLIELKSPGCEWLSLCETPATK